MTIQTVNILSTEFEPKNEYVLVKPEKLNTGEKKSDSGIIIEIAQNQESFKRPSFGEVISVGQDIKDINIGNFILWPETDGIDLEFNDGIFMLLRYKSIIGKKRAT